MHNKEHTKRANFTSSIGFIMASAGSAIGLGNLWKFPYVAGSNGGGVFFFFFILFSIILGMPIILSEMSIGRKTQLSAVGAYKKINKKWGFIGGIGVFCSFIILSYYSVVGGWVLKYIFAYITNTNFGPDKSKYFNYFISSASEPVVWHILFMTFCTVIILKGVVNGIEKVSKIMLPCLFILILIIVGHSVTLPGASDGLRFLFTPNFSEIDSFSKLAKVIVAALGQVFFSLSLGLGITITYGSYLKSEVDLPRNTLVITVLDTLIAIFCGAAIFPAVFSFGFEPQAGAGLIFETLPAVFGSMKFGVIFGLIFFILVFFAAATSAIALLEVVCAYFIDSLKWSRKKSAVLVALAAAFIGTFASLSMGKISFIKIFGLNIFDFLSYCTDKILMPLAALFMCLFVNNAMGINAVSEEASRGAKSFKTRYVFEFIMKYIAPALIIIVFIIGLIS